jgi:dTDP-4-dehydrorhamnose 3,5-epimerase-like enzyme
MSLIEHHKAKNFAVPLHLHHEEDESFYMLEGEVRFQLGDDVLTMESGSAARVPAGTAHSFRVLSDEARFLTMTTGRFEQMVRSLARPATDPGLPPQVESTSEQVAALVAACEDHGIQFVGPSVV